MTLSALLLVDVQYDFLPGGSLAVQSGDEVLPVIRELLKGNWEWVVASQDYHPPKHISFASTHSKDAFTSIHVPFPYAKEGEPSTIAQMLWPDHCVQNTHGAFIEESITNALKPWFDKNRASIIQKGTDIRVEAYSAFESPIVQPEESSLGKILKEHNIDTLFVVGIATDYCVRASALDANKAGLNVFVIKEGVRAVGGEVATEKVAKEWEKAGVRFVNFEDDVVKAWLG
ncbi:Isochorismatase hydrolase [Rickenella mellea]|uniref:nicotinamidase n=1 Tax=Rickenella mellea TaxID=50990 RepID=A0A4Y7PY16_9AGAM|nr:Isochorismatase hydrolase [Rickenella mellea]